ncbi:calmodulin-binding protein 25-like [Silene latifolia]|uniref:calmodulin-binding protein 25-like n=1 Tax=Silene latifolia TaxID=37657 RepID=UPI003D78ACD9
MASILEMASFDTWAYQSTFDNTWISETFTKETDVLTKAFTNSITNVSDTENVSFTETPFSFLAQPGSSSNGSDPDPEPELESKPEPEMQCVSKRPSRNVISKKITKRKTRASKRSNTTFIHADPANFRQMVQQVTGVRFGSVHGLVLKPEAQQLVSESGHLPTLDTSAFLLDHHQQVVGSHNVINGPSYGSNVSSTNRPGFDFDGLTCFPTLESWKVV